MTRYASGFAAGAAASTVQRLRRPVDEVAR
jgi:hypothetical protein